MSARFEDVDLADVDRWCRTHLGTNVAEELFRVGHLSAVIGLRLGSGRPIVVKVRRPAERLAACWSAHQHLFKRGFPCPEPLVGPEPLGDHAASAEALVTGGAVFPTSGRAAGPFAHSLARLIELAPRRDELPTLEPPLPWTSPSHRAPGLWPWPDDQDIDLNTIDGPAWIDEAGKGARDRLSLVTREGSPEPIVGHGDWYTANLRWRGHELHVAYDWDSVIAESEPVIVGLAAALYPATRDGTEATVEETQAFIDAYAGFRGHPFTRAQSEECWAAGLWNRSFDAKKQFAARGQVRSLSQAEARERLRKAGTG